MEKDFDDQQRQECEVLVEEYKRINEEILKRIDFLDKNINYQFILLGIVATAITSILAGDKQLAEQLVPIKFILLISPIIFFLLGFYYSINNMYTFKISQYITKNIKPQLSSLLKSKSVLGYDNYIQLEVFKLARKSHKVVSFIVLQWSISIPIILLGAYFVLEYSSKDDGFSRVRLFLMIINAVLLMLSIKINFDQYEIIKPENQTNAQTESKFKQK